MRAVAGDVADPAHRAELVAAAGALGGLDLLVNNASVLGPSPLPPLADYPLDDARRRSTGSTSSPRSASCRWRCPLLRRAGGAIVNITSDAAVEAYEGWGGYGSSKAALEQLTQRARRRAARRCASTAFDPGDMRTQMHQDAFPGEDISDRPEPGDGRPGAACACSRERAAERPLPGQPTSWRAADDAGRSRPR